MFSGKHCPFSLTFPRSNEHLLSDLMRLAKLVNTSEIDPFYGDIFTISKLQLSHKVSRTFSVEKVER